jgi:hypothetical protein
MQFPLKVASEIKLLMIPMHKKVPGPAACVLNPMVAANKSGLNGIFGEHYST